MCVFTLQYWISLLCIFSQPLVYSISYVYGWYTNTSGTQVQVVHRDRYEWYIAKMDHMLRIAKWYMVQVVHCMCTHIVTRDEADQRTRSCCTVMPCLHIP